MPRRSKRKARKTRRRARRRAEQRDRSEADKGVANRLLERIFREAEQRKVVRRGRR